MPDRATILRAGWIVPAQAPPLADGAVVTAGGRIVRVGPWRTVEPHVGPADTVRHVADSAVLPGLLNAHTHLGLSDMAGKFKPTENFPAWIGRLTGRLMLRSAGSARRAVETGRDLALTAGTAGGAEITYDSALADPLADGGVRWTVFGELFRFGDKAVAHVARTAEALADLAGRTGLAVGLAPHAPYSTGAEVFLAARREADARGWPVTTHLHETEEEFAFTERGEGPFAAWMRRLRVLPSGWRPPGVRPIPLLAEAGFFAGPVLVAHANYLTDDEIGILARSGSAVAWCPRSHAFFGHRDHPWRRLRAAGVPVCLGTDSLASAPSLSMLDEIRFVFSREPGADPQTLLAMATVEGARALGAADRLGDLREGLSAAACVVGPLPRTDNPLAAILAGEGSVTPIFPAAAPE